jgi:hypothetical protein
MCYFSNFLHSFIRLGGVLSDIAQLGNLPKYCAEVRRGPLHLDLLLACKRVPHVLNCLAKFDLPWARTFLGPLSQYV